MESPEFDSDLPLLAFGMEPLQHVDWEALMEAGVLPAMALGAERRFRGPRSLAAQHLCGPR